MGSGNCGENGTQHGLHVTAGLLHGALLEAGVEGLGFKLGNPGVLGAGLAQDAFAVKLVQQSTSGFTFGVNSGTGVAALLGDVGVGLAAALVNGTLGLAAAILLGRHDVEGVAQSLHLIGVSGTKLGNHVVLLADLVLETSGQHGSLGTRLTLSELGGDVLHGGDGTAKTFTELRAKVGNLHELVTTNGVNIGTHGGQRVHQKLIGAVVAARIATITVVPVVVAVPTGAYGTTNSTANESAPAIAPAIVVAVNVECRLKTLHSNCSLQWYT